MSGIRIQVMVMEQFAIFFEQFYRVIFRHGCFSSRLIINLFGFSYMSECTLFHNFING